MLKTGSDINQFAREIEAYVEKTLYNLVRRARYLNEIVTQESRSDEYHQILTSIQPLLPGAVAVIEEILLAVPNEDRNRNWDVHQLVVDLRFAAFESHGTGFDVREPGKAREAMKALFTEFLLNRVREEDQQRLERGCAALYDILLLGPVEGDIAGVLLLGKIYSDGRPSWKTEIEYAEDFHHMLVTPRWRYVSDILKNEQLRWDAFLDTDRHALWALGKTKGIEPLITQFKSAWWHFHSFIKHDRSITGFGSFTYDAADRFKASVAAHGLQAAAEQFEYVSQSYLGIIARLAIGLSTEAGRKLRDRVRLELADLRQKAVPAWNTMMAMFETSPVFELADHPNEALLDLVLFGFAGNNPRLAEALGLNQLYRHNDLPPLVEALAAAEATQLRSLIEEDQRRFRTACEHLDSPMETRNWIGSTHLDVRFLAWLTDLPRLRTEHRRVLKEFADAADARKLAHSMYLRLTDEGKTSSLPEIVAITRELIDNRYSDLLAQTK